MNIADSVGTASYVSIITHFTLKCSELAFTRYPNIGNKFQSLIRSHPKLQKLAPIITNLWFLAGIATFLICSRHNPLSQRICVIVFTTIVKVYPPLNRLAYKIGLFIYENRTPLYLESRVKQQHLQVQQQPIPPQQIELNYAPCIPPPLPPYEKIHERWSEDLILSKFTCVINHTPIRKPIFDPSTGNLYEMESIYNWLRIKNSSPMTRQEWPSVDILFQIYISKAYSILNSFIDFRVSQLENREKELGRPLNKSDKEWMDLSAKDLDRSIQTFFQSSIEEIISHPPDFILEFLRKNNFFVCPISKKIIEKPALLTNASEYLVLDIRYDADSLRDFLSAKPDEIPPGWPIYACPPPIQERITYAGKGDDSRREKLLQARDLLRRYYTSLE